MEISYWIFVFSILLFFLVSGSSSIDNFHQPFPIVEPDPGHTKLRLSREGLEAISRITTPISAVAVIGPYRSGKSFLLNQLLSLSCDEGFGVGHMRDTKTKGIWVWGTPLEMDIDGVRTSVFYLDTEGFESVGKSNVYDDRIFALATVMSSVLIYNLPETIREADISRLSFVVELAEEFYGRGKALLLNLQNFCGLSSVIFCKMDFNAAEEEEFGFSRNYFLAKEMGSSGKKSARKLSDINVVDEHELREASANIEPKHQNDIADLINSYKSLYPKWVFDLS